MRVLITGHKGYIGMVAVPILQAQGFTVSGIDNDLFEGCNFGGASFYGNPPDIPYIRKDIRDVELYDFKGIDAVVHLCALSNDPLGNLNPEITYEINYEASVKVAKLAKQAGVQRFIFMSSCSVYGAAGADMVTEESELNPVTPYGVSKVKAEKEIKDWQMRISVRLFYVQQLLTVCLLCCGLTSFSITLLLGLIQLVLYY